MVELHHFSDKKLDRIDPVFAGTGTLKGPEAKAGWKASFYGIAPRDNTRAPGTGYVKEDKQWIYDHVVEVDPRDLYPWYENPDGIDTGTNEDEFRQNIKKAGWPGYYITDDGSGRAPLGNVAVMFNAKPVTSVNEDTRMSSLRFSTSPTGPGTASGAGATQVSVAAPNRSNAFDTHLVEANGELVYTRTSKVLEKVLGVFMRDADRRQKVADDIIMKFQDRFIPVGRMVDELRANGFKVGEAIDVYMREINMHGHVGEQVRARTEGIYNPLGNTVAQIDLRQPQVAALRSASDAASPSGVGFVSSAIDSFRKNELSFRTRALTALGMTDPDRLAIADSYLYAKHAKSRNKWVLEQSGNPEEVGSGMTDVEADAIIRYVESLPPEQRQVFTRLAELRNQIVADTNAVRKEAGLIPQDMESGMENYVPLRGKLDADGYIEESHGAAISAPYAGVKGREDRRIAGRTEAGYATSSPVAELISQNQRSILRAEKNKVGQSLLELLRQYKTQTSKWAEITDAPMGKTIGGGVTSFNPRQPLPSDILTVKEDGKIVYVKFNDHRMQRAFGTHIHPQETGAIVSAMSNLTRFLANVNTSWNPEFMLSNFPRDVQTALVNASQYDIDGVWKDIAGPRKMKDTALAIRAVLRGVEGNVTNDNQIDMIKWFKEFREAGAMNTTNMMGNVENIENGIDRALGLISTEGKKNFGQRNAAKMVKGFDGILNVLEDYNTVVENIVRVNFYKALRTRGASQERAAQASRDLTTNFAKGGEYKTFMNGAYLFYNASLQGTVALTRALMRSRKVQAIWATTILVGALQDQIGAMLSDEDEEGNLLWDQIADYDLEHNIIMPDIFGITDKGYFKIPLAYGLNMAYNAGRANSRFMRGGYDAQDLGASMYGTVMETIWPLGGDESYFNAFAPTALDPVVDLLENRNFMDAPIYKEDAMFGVGTPSAYRHWTSTGSAAKWITENVNDITGGNEVREGMVSMNPDILEYLFEYFTGATGATVNRTVDTVFRLPEIIKGEAEQEFVRQVPLLRKLYSTIPERQDVSTFFEKSEKVERARKELKRAVEVEDAEWVASVRKNYAKELSVYGQVRALTNARNKIKRQMNQIIATPKIPEERKKVMLDTLEKRLADIIRKANAVMKDI